MVRTLGCALAACALLLVTAPRGTATGMAGRITGVVTLVAPAGSPLRSGAYPSRQVNPQAPPTPEVSNVVIFVKGATAPARLPVTRSSIAQKNESFVPRVAAITRGSTVDFPNFDPYFHNVFSLSRNATFDLGRFPRGQTRTHTFPRAGLVKVFCHIHSEMSASIMVLEHPYFTIPAGDGSFALDDVPAGAHTLSAWHERIGESSKPVAITNGGTVRVDFALPVEVR